LRLAPTADAGADADADADDLSPCGRERIFLGLALAKSLENPSEGIYFERTEDYPLSCDF
jgi:hypothetical protein